MVNLTFVMRLMCESCLMVYVISVGFDGGLVTDGWFSYNAL